MTQGDTDQKDTEAVEPTEATPDAAETPTEDTAPAPEAEATPEPAAPAPTPKVTDDAPTDEEPLVTPGFDWFVLRVASNKEDSVKETLLRKIKIEGLDNRVSRILVPTEKKKTMKAGRTRVTETKLYPGYVFVEMRLEDDGRIPQDVFFLIKETTGVGDFIGTAGRPAPMQMHEVEKMVAAAKPVEEQPEIKMEFAPGDAVKITDGAFENMDGNVDKLLPEQGKVVVIVTIFGRATPVELEYWQIEKIEDQ